MTTYSSLGGSEIVSDWSYKLPAFDHVNMEQTDEVFNYCEGSELRGTSEIQLQHSSSSVVKEDSQLNETLHDSDENDIVFPMKIESGSHGTITFRELKEYAHVNPENYPETENNSQNDLEVSELKEHTQDRTEGASININERVPDISVQHIPDNQLNERAQDHSETVNINIYEKLSDSLEQYRSDEIKMTELKEFPLEQEEDGSSSSHESDSGLESVCVETIQNRVRLVKAYSWIKEEMLKSTANGVADRLYQHQSKLLSRLDHESIYAAKPRRDAVELLLKRILMGPNGIHDVFMDALNQEGGEDFAEQLNQQPVTQTDIEAFTTLEKSAVHATPRSYSDEPRLTFTKRNKRILAYWLNDREVVDSINDHLFSRLIFRIDEHTNIADNSMDTKKKLKRLIETMALCSESVFKDFFEILDLDTVNMSHVIPNLKRDNAGDVISRQKEKRKSSSSIEDIIEPTPTKRSRTQQALSESKESRIVQTIQQPDSNVWHVADRNFGFQVVRVDIGSIIIQLTPKDSDSWRKLKVSCRSGKIKDFIPEVFRNNEADMEEGEYTFRFSIYTLPTPPYSPADKKVMFHLEAKQPKSIDIEENSKLLCQELEITNDLLAKLQKEKMVDENIKRDIAKIHGRRNKIMFLLDEIALHGDRGYTILKEYIRNTNEYLYRRLVTRDALKKVNTTLPEVANVTPRPGSASRENRKEVFYSSEVVLLVKKREVKQKGGKKRTDVEITCPTVLCSECFFSDEEEAYGYQSDEEFFSLEDTWVYTAEQQEPKEGLGAKRKSRSSSDSTDISQESLGKKVQHKTEDDDTKERKEAAQKTARKDDSTSRSLEESEETTKREKGHTLKQRFPKKKN